jgi:PIN domain nuclease of toxin-antitoxin system
MIVLDTHVLVWWATGDKTKLTKRAASAISREHKNGALCVSSISAWEIAMLVARARLHLTVEVSAWLNTAAQIENLRFVPVDNTIAIGSVQLPDPFHADPADRIIVATARTLGAALVTADEKIRGYASVETIW